MNSAVSSTLGSQIRVVCRSGGQEREREWGVGSGIIITIIITGEHVPTVLGATYGRRQQSSLGRSVGLLDLFRSQKRATNAVGAQF